ncbi:MAG TPA: 5-formyltetrahydrofolate cyclo-ligase [Candidatus Brachybacterium merdigallinarum]|nr:5-formyltetrahydrofolate cyclo-ligase [Candidatus Brachybacterium merdigallinarum]
MDAAHAPASDPASGPAPDPALRERKSQLRTALRTRRQEIYGAPAGAERRSTEAQQLCDHAAPLLEDALGQAETLVVAAYHPLGTEADVMPVARALASRGARLIFPAAAGRELEWIRWDGHSDFVPSPGRGFGREPEGERLGAGALAEAALVLAPAVAIDRSGTRLGHGAGYYDRALRHRTERTPVVAVVHPHELLDAGSLPRDVFDVPVDAVLTAAGLTRLPAAE